ncbi:MULTISPECIES: P-loop NTPase [Calditerrivibrio]|uniref:P-loop NTPase n=1 Tax=Calditerrivibrio TaxID=545865 RepID=UPI003C744AE9
MFEKNKNKSKTSIISVASGKGGVGKSNFALNLALTLSRLGKKTCLLDADLSLGNADLLLGSKPTYTLEHLLSDEIFIDDIVFTSEKYPNFYLIPAGSGVTKLASLTNKERNYLIKKISNFKVDIEYLIIDCAAGASNDVSRFIEISNTMVLMLIPEVTSIKDAYSLLKILKSKNIIKPVQVVINRAQNRSQVENIFKKFKEAVTNFLGLDISLLGPVPEEPLVREAVNKQTPVIYLSPNGVTTRIFNEFAKFFIKNNEANINFNEFFNTIFSVEVSDDKNHTVEQKEVPKATDEAIAHNNKNSNDMNTVEFTNNESFFLVNIEKSIQNLTKELNQLNKIFNIFARKQYKPNIEKNYFNSFEVGKDLIFVYNEDRFFSTKIIGWDLGKYILVESSPPIIEMLIKGECKVRYMFDDKLIEFSTKAFQLITEYTDIIKISYPKQYKEFSLRNNKRYPINRECKIYVRDLPPYDGTVLDISTNGLLLLSNNPLHIGETIRLKFVLPNGKEIDELLGVVKNLRDSNKYGILIQEKKPIFIKYISEYIDLYEKILGEKSEQSLKTSLTGNLETVNLKELIKLTALSNKNALLEITSKDLEGKIYFRKGNVIHAECNNLKGVDAFYEMINTNSGEFTLYEYNDYIEPTISETINKLMVDAEFLANKK